MSCNFAKKCASMGSSSFHGYHYVVGCLSSVFHLDLFFLKLLKLRQFSFVVGGWIIGFELYPGFSLFRGLYEFSQYASRGFSSGTYGMQWRDLSESGMKEVLVIMIVEWLVILIFAYYVDKIASSGSSKSPLFFLQKLRKKPSSSSEKPTLQRQESKVLVQMEKPDVNQEVTLFVSLYFLLLFRVKLSKHVKDHLLDCKKAGLLNKICQSSKT